MGMDDDDDDITTELGQFVNIYMESVIARSDQIWRALFTTTNISFYSVTRNGCTRMACSTSSTTSNHFLSFVFIALTPDSKLINTGRRAVVYTTRQP